MNVCRDLAQDRAVFEAARERVSRIPLGYDPEAAMGGVERRALAAVREALALSRDLGIDREAVAQALGLSVATLHQFVCDRGRTLPWHLVFRMLVLDALHEDARRLLWRLLADMGQVGVFFLDDIDHDGGGFFAQVLEVGGAVGAIAAGANEAMADGVVDPFERMRLARRCVEAEAEIRELGASLRGDAPRGGGSA